ncbi:MAG TPA: hypothetical protein VMV00_01875 [Candidatus Baltobacteraceae bacterium]|nr:hypothetical protein [Candidatus Baltobacteraceae bacterium]
MVKAIIDISDSANRILGIIKAEFGLKDKSQAINKLTQEYKEMVFEPKIKPSYLKRLKKIEQEPLIHVGSLKDFRKRYHMD